MKHITTVRENRRYRLVFHGSMGYIGPAALAALELPGLKVDRLTSEEAYLAAQKLDEAVEKNQVRKKKKSS